MATANDCFARRRTLTYLGWMTALRTMLPSAEVPQP